MMRILLAGFIVLMLDSALAADFEAAGAGPMTPTEPTARPWDLKIRTSFGYNDNVNVVPDVTFFSGETDSPYFGLQLEGSYRFVQSREWTAGIALAVDRIWYTNDQNNPDPDVNDDADEYNLLVVEPTIYVDHRLSIFGRPASVGMAYDFRFEDLDENPAGGFRGHTLAWNLGISPCAEAPDLWLAATYSLGFNNFDVDLPAPSLVRRGGTVHEIDLTAQYEWDAGRRRVAATYTFLANDADSRNFEYVAHGVKLRLESHLVGALWVGVDFGYEYADYDGFIGGGVPPPGRERQEIFHYGATFIYVFSRHWSVDVFYRHEDIQSNQAQFETKTNNVGIGLTYRF